MVIAWSTVALALAGVWLSGSEPGLSGTLGFCSETVLAMWIPGGWLALAASIVCACLRLWRPCTAVFVLAALVLGPDAWGWVAGSQLDASSTSHSPRKAARGPESTSTSAGGQLRIATFNLAGQNDEDPAIEEAIKRLDADVLVLPEMTTWRQEQMKAWFEHDYEHRWLADPPPEPGVSLEGLQLAIWSRIPAVGKPEVVEHLGLGTQLRVELRWQGRSFVLYGIHANKPWPRSLYRSAFRGRKELLARMREEHGALVVAGDFNAPPRSAFLARLRELGLRSASIQALGYAPTTWPMHKAKLAPFRVAIDHVLVSKDFECTGFGRGMLTLSDHAPVLCTLQWR